MKKNNTILFLLKNKKSWEHEDFCFVVNSKKLESNIDDIKKYLHGDIFYSYKTNPDFNVAKIIIKKNIGLLFSSVEELKNIATLREFNADKSSFQSPSLTKEQFLEIKKLGVKKLVVDSQDQLDLILDNIDGNEILELLIRINTGVKVDIPELPYGEDSYLGFPLAEAMDVFRKLNVLRDKGLIKLGVHNHLISQNTHLDIWAENTQKIADFVQELKTDGVGIDTVDFGGGYPIEYLSDVPSTEAIGKIIYKAQERMSATFPDLKYIFEPGRKVVGESIVLIGRVTHIKNFLDNKIAILNCSLYNCSMDTLIVDLYLKICKVSDENSENLEKYIIRGSTPDSLDIFSRGVSLPRLANGDALAFLNAGAYSFGSEFISLPKPKYIIA